MMGDGVQQMADARKRDPPLAIGPPNWAMWAEWAPGRAPGPEVVDTRGLSVVFEPATSVGPGGPWIRPAQPGEVPCGVVSSDAATGFMAYNAANHAWHQAVATDAWGDPLQRRVLSHVYYDEATYRRVKLAATAEALATLPEGAEVSVCFDTPVTASAQWQQGAELYVPRVARPSWVPVVMLGLVRVRQGQPRAPTWLVTHQDAAAGDDVVFVR